MSPRDDDRPGGTIPEVDGEGKPTGLAPVVVLGGYGVFGSQVSCELARRGVAVAVAGRDASRARGLAEALGPPHESLCADASDLESCRRAVRGRRVAVLAAGPYGEIGTSLAEACRLEGCGYADLADDRDHVARLRAKDGAFREAGLAAVYGASSLPGLSGALALAAAHGREGTGAPESARVVLFIGNANRKGPGAIDSMVGSMGRAIQTPQGVLRGLGDPDSIELPPPFGRQTVANLDAPEYDLFGPLLGVREVRVALGFELPGAIRLFSILAALGRAGRLAARLGARCGRILSPWGSSGGFVVTELRYPGGEVRRAAIGGPADGQRMAVLPSVLAAERMLEGGGPPGVQTAYEYLGYRKLLERVREAGFDLSVDPPPIG